MGTPWARVVGLGQPFAGDDGVGFAVVEHLRAGGLPEGVVADVVAEPSALVGELGEVERLVVVDAVVGAGAPGTVVVLELDDLGDEVRPVSTHGMSLGQAVAIARILCAERDAPRVHVVGVAIDVVATERGAVLSAPIRAAIPRAAAAVRRLFERDS